MGPLRLTVFAGGRGKVGGRAGQGEAADRESSARLDPLIDTVVAGRFRVHKLIASGGMGRVYRATQQPINRPVALKVILHDESGAPDTGALQRFQREAAILARLQHPNIVALHDFGEVDGAFHGRSYLAMELLEGKTLAECLDEGRLAPRRAVSIAEQVARGLRCAHRRGVIHRDLKPSNIMLVNDDNGDEVVKLVDFGIGWVEDGTSRKLTRTGAVMGTIGYMAPEQLHGVLSPAIDMFALGVVLFEALTGLLPFDDAVAGPDRGLEPPRLGVVAPELELPEGLESLVTDLLARVADERPTAVEVLDRLAACARALETTEGSSAPLAMVARRTSQGASRASSAKHTTPEVRLITSNAPPALDDDVSAASDPPPPSPATPLTISGAAVRRLAIDRRTARVLVGVALASAVALAIVLSRGGARRPAAGAANLAATTAALALPAATTVMPTPAATPAVKTASAAIAPLATVAPATAAPATVAPATAAPATVAPVAVAVTRFATRATAREVPPTTAREVPPPASPRARAAGPATVFSTE